MPAELDEVDRRIMMQLEIERRRCKKEKDAPARKERLERCERGARRPARAGATR
jgi:hypothetical protein